VAGDAIALKAGTALRAPVSGRRRRSAAERFDGVISTCGSVASDRHIRHCTVGKRGYTQVSLSMPRYHLHVAA